MAGIRIDAPCSEHYEAMPKTEMGAYCGRCRFEVIDFTTMSTDEIRTVLLGKAGQKMCGHIGATQMDMLNRDFTEWKRGHHAFRKTMVMALLVVFGLSLFACAHSDDRTRIQSWRKEALQWVGISGKGRAEVEPMQTDVLPDTTVTGEICIQPSHDMVNGGLSVDPEYMNYLREE